MENGYLYHAIPFLKDLSKERRKQFEEYFQTAPIWLMDSFRIEKLDKGVIFVRENTPVDTIYFIGKGSIKGTDYRVFGVSYDYMRFDGVYAMGGMEIILDLETYRTTLETVTPCTVLKIPKNCFEKWIKNDIKALKKEAKQVTEYLLREGRRNRINLFLQGQDRLIYLLANQYETYAKNDLLVLGKTRQKLADETGLCIKTVNRAMSKLDEEGMIEKSGHKILIREEHYKRLKERLTIIADLW